MDVDDKLRQNQRIEKITKKMGNYLPENITENKAKRATNERAG